MGKIGDLWVRLGLKSDDYKKGMDDAKKTTSSFSSGMTKMKAGVLAVWAAIGAGVTSFVKDFIGATNTMNDAWQRTMNAMKASYQTVLADMSTYKPDFSSFRNFFKNEWKWIKNTFSNAQEAGDAAKEMTKAFDAEFELVNSVKLQKAMIQEELNELYIAMRNTALNPADRKAAAERYRSLLQPLADAEIRIYSNMLEKASDAWQAGSGLSRKYSTEEMRDFFANYGVDPEGTASRYSELASVYENRKGDAQNQVIYDILTRMEQANAQMSDVNRVLSRSELAIDKALSDFDKALAADLEAGLQETYDEIDAMEDIEIVIPEIDMSAFDNAENKLKNFVEEWRAEQQKLAMYNEMIADSIIASASSGMQALTDMIFGIGDADMTDVLAAFLQPFADTLKQMGSMIMAEGIAMEAFKKSFVNPYAAIAAGAALIAIGSMVSSGLQALTANPSGGTGSSASYGGNSYGASESMNYENTLTVYVEGKVSGSDILLAGSNQQNKWNR